MKTTIRLGTGRGGWLAMALVWAALSLPASAAIYTWTGATDFDWKKPGNWSGGSGGYPFDTLSQADTVNIVTAGTYTITNVPKAAATLLTTDPVLLGTVIIGNGTIAPVVTLTQVGSGILQVGSVDIRANATLTFDVWDDWTSRLGGVTGITNNFTLAAGARFRNPGKDFYVRGTYTFNVNAASNMTVGRLYFQSGLPANPWTLPFANYDSAAQLSPNGGKLYLNGMTGFGGSYLTVDSNPCEVHFDPVGAQTLPMAGTTLNLIGNGQFLILGANDTLEVGGFVYDVVENKTWMSNLARFQMDPTSTLLMHGGFSFDPDNNYLYDRDTGKKIYDMVSLFRFAGTGTIKSGTRSTTTNGPELWHDLDFLAGASYSLLDDIWGNGNLTYNGVLTNTESLVSLGVLTLNGHDLFGFTEFIPEPASQALLALGGLALLRRRRPRIV